MLLKKISASIDIYSKVFPIYRGNEQMIKKMVFRQFILSYITLLFLFQYDLFGQPLTAEQIYKKVPVQWLLFKLTTLIMNW